MGCGRDRESKRGFGTQLAGSGELYHRGELPSFASHLLAAAEAMLYLFCANISRVNWPIFSQNVH